MMLKFIVGPDAELLTYRIMQLFIGLKR